MFPLQAIIGQGASETAWRQAFLLVFALVTFLTVISTRGVKWQAFSLASLVLIGVWAYRFPKIGVAFMPALDEGTTLDMPITVPRASVTQAADDLKARDALLRGFPEVESVIGKAGRADTPTDPAPLDMVETFVNFRPKELWPKRVLRYADAADQTARVLDVLQDRGYIEVAATESDRSSLIVEASQRSLLRFDETMRSLAQLRYAEFERELGPRLVRFAVADILRRMRKAHHLSWAADVDESQEIDRMTNDLASRYGRWLAKSPSLEDLDALCHDVAKALADRTFRSLLRFLYLDVTSFDVALDPGKNLELAQSFLASTASDLKALFGADLPTFAGEVTKAVENKRMHLWQERVHEINWELFDRGTEAYTWYALEELVKAAGHAELLDSADARPRCQGVCRSGNRGRAWPGSIRRRIPWFHGDARRVGGPVSKARLLLAAQAWPCRRSG